MGIEIIISYIETLLCFKFLEIVLKSKFRDNKTKICICIFSLLLTLIISLINFIKLYSGILLIFVIISISIISLFIFEVKLKESMTLVGIYYFVITIMDLLAIFTLSIITQNYEIGSLFISNANFYRCIYLCVMKTLTFLIYVFVRNYIKNWNWLFDYCFFWLISVFLGYCALSYFQQFVINEVTEMLASNWILFLGILLLFVTSFLLYSKYRDYREKNKIIIIRNEILKKSYDNLQQLFQENEHLLHDLKNHAVIICNYIKCNNNEKALAYIESITAPIKKTDNIIKSSIEILNIILNSKAAEAQANNIDISYEVEVKPCNIDENDLCSILSNLLDNAIEASVKDIKENRYIKMTVKSINNMLMIKIQNNISEKPVIVGPSKFKTTKVMEANHGIGLESIKYCVEKYNGNIKFEYGIDFFLVEILLLSVK